MKKYIIAIDQGTTSSRVLLINKKTEIVDKDYIEISKKELSNGEILQNPVEILSSVEELINRLFKRNNLDPEEVDSIAITNQRETTVLWDKNTGKPIYNAISWQASHTKDITDEWKNNSLGELVFNKTGLLINPYFSASKIVHILNKNKNINIDDILFGNIDSYLLWNLSVEKNHYTDSTNASRTMLYNINTFKWDNDLLELFNIPKNILPKVLKNDSIFGNFKYGNTLIPIRSMIGDQQSALFGHLCTNIGDIKITYGTGCFILANIGQNPKLSNNGLLTTIAWNINNKPNYALEGSVFMGGSAVSWMKDKLNLVNHANETEQMAKGSKNDSVYVVPAFAGLGAPYWDNDVRASILGLEAGTTKADIMKATLNSIAYQVADVLELMKNSVDIKINNIAVDGGASNNGYLMQFQSDLINVRLTQNTESEITGLGSAFLAGISSGFWNSIDEIKKLQKIKKIFIPNNNKDEISFKYAKWKKAVMVTKEFK